MPDFKIDCSGRWYHKGEEIRRPAIVKLLAGQLSCENGRHFLRAPGQKLPVDVADAPFLVVEMHSSGRHKSRCIEFACNLDRRVSVDINHPLEFRDHGSGEHVPYCYLGEGLWAKLGRNVYYELARIVLDELPLNEVPGVWSHSVFFPFDVTDDA